MNMRVASIVVALVVTVTVPARAQGHGQPPPNAQDLVAQLADLQARVAKLEGNIGASDLAGTYAVTGLSTTMTALHVGPPVVNATINTSALAATLTVNPDGTGTVSSTMCEGSTLIQGTWSMRGLDCREPASAFTWQYANGVITISFTDTNEDLPFSVALGGRFLILAFAPFHPSDPSSDQTLLIATRLR